jgi:hypothetical protein
LASSGGAAELYPRGLEATGDERPVRAAVPRRRLRIALLGTRGIPASYSGFETFYEELGVRLAERGHSVTVYNRSHYVRYRNPPTGVKLVRLPSIRPSTGDHRHKGFHAPRALRGFDIYYVHRRQ